VVGFVLEQQKIYVVMSASFGAEILDCKALGVGFEREDVDTDRRGLVSVSRREGSVWFGRDNLFRSCRVLIRISYNL